MSNYRLRVQVQQGDRQEIAAATYNQDSPCSRRQAQALLDEVERKAANFYSDWEWRRRMAQAIERAKGWVNRANRMDASGGSRTVHTEPFNYANYAYRVDIEINAGDGHFQD